MPHGRTDPGSGFGPPRYPGAFLLALREGAAGLGWQVRQVRGVHATCTDAGGRDYVVGLDNLFRRARQSGSREGWPALIAEFLKTVAGIDQPEMAIPKDLHGVAEQLLLRVGCPTVPAQAEKVWSRPLAGTDLAVCLVIDFPDRLCYVTEQLLAASGPDPDVWVGRALDNLLARTPADCLPVAHEETGLRLCGVGDSYDSSRALLLDKLLPDAGPDGYFVALPARDQLLVLPVTREALACVPLMKGFAQKSYRSLPYPISDQVFWVRGGAWLPFDVELQGEKVTIRPPDEFVDTLKRLAPEEESPG
jgi:hypothetical protein